MKRDDLQFFDKTQDFAVFDQRRLPHWIQAGTLCFITWRVADSLPQGILKQLDAEIDQYLTTLGISIIQELPDFLEKSDLKTRSQIHWRMFTIRDHFLNRGMGRCPLRNPIHAYIVLDSLRTFDEDRYFLTDAVVMPNHVHFIAAFGDNDSMLQQCTAWKRFTGRAINQLEGRTGEFWQADQFDHLIRGERQFAYFRQYISENPTKPKLREGEFLHWSKNLDNTK